MDLITYALARKDIAAVQSQVDKLVVQGDSSVEAAQARVDAAGVSHATLKTRADSDYNYFENKTSALTSQLAEKATQNDLTTAITPKADKTYVDSELGKKTDKTYTDAQLAFKRDKGTKITSADMDTSTDVNKIKLINLADEVQQALTGNAPALSTIADGAVGTTKLADGALNRAKSGTSLGSMSDGIYSAVPPLMTSVSTDIKILFSSSDKRIFYKNIERRDIITLTTLEYVIPTNFSLVYVLGDFTNLYVKDTDSLTTNDYIILSNHNGKAKINNIQVSNIEHLNEIVFCPGLVRYEVSGTTINIYVSLDTRLFLRSGSINIQGALATSYSLATSQALVWNTYTNTVAIKSWDALILDDIVLIGNSNGRVKTNNINAISRRIYEDDIIYYGGTVSLSKVSTDIIVKFSSGETRLFYKTIQGNTWATLSVLEYTVPHNFSLVLNVETNILEIVNSDNVIRGKHWVLVSCHQGLPKKKGIRFENDIRGYSTGARIPTKLTAFPVSQDGCVVGDEVWMFDESDSGHTNIANIHRLNKSTFEVIGTITHNLGHANGADYRNGKLLVFNGGGYPPEINLYNNPVGKTSLSVSDVDNVQIIFSEGIKVLEGDGSACFGESEKIVYYVGYRGIHKILLGMGDNDLSDKTVDKNDLTRWGTFVVGKSQTEYNGTAQVLKTYNGYIGQPQGLTYDGYLYVATDYSRTHAFKIELNDNAGIFNIVDDYFYNHTDYKNTLIPLEPESVFLLGQKVFIGSRSIGLSIIAELDK